VRGKQAVGKLSSTCSRPPASACWLGRACGDAPAPTRTSAGVLQRLTPHIQARTPPVSALCAGPSDSANWHPGSRLQLPYRLGHSRGPSPVPAGQIARGRRAGICREAAQKMSDAALEPIRPVLHLPKPLLVAEPLSRSCYCSSHDIAKASFAIHVAPRSEFS